jgi:hypothetical protein
MMLEQPIFIAIGKPHMWMTALAPQMCSEPAERLEMKTSAVFTQNSHTATPGLETSALEQHEDPTTFSSGDGARNPYQNNTRPSTYSLDTRFSKVEPRFHKLIQRVSITERCGRELHMTAV